VQKSILLTAVQKEIYRHDFSYFVDEPPSVVQGGKGVYEYMCLISFYWCCPAFSRCTGGTVGRLRWACKIPSDELASITPTIRRGSTAVQRKVIN